jgi:thiamine kinase
VPNPPVQERLSALPGMGEARLLEQLADGPTNTSYLVERGAERFVLRLDKPEARQLGLDRDNERAVCEKLAEAGLTPAYRHFDAAAGVCLRPFVAGRSLRGADLLEPRMLERLAGVLRRLHRLPPVGLPFDVAGAARRYAAQLATPQASMLAERAAGLLTEIGRQGGAAALCHNDLVAENVLETPQGDLLLIDWEYAAVGDPYFDLAVVVRHHQLDPSLARHFFGAYLQRAPAEEESARFALQCRLYDGLLALWNLRVSELQEAAGRPSAEERPGST